MIPVNIEDMIEKTTNKAIRSDSRQFYYSTLLAIKKKIDIAIKEYEKEKNFK